MAEQIISSKAKWNLQEVIPVIIMLGIGLFAIYMFLSGTWMIEMAIIIGGFGLGLFAYLTFLNLRRKHKSTLFAELANDDNYNISVWMRQPLKHKWNGKLDKGKNKAALAKTRFVTMDSILSTRVIVFNMGKDKNFYLPVRFVQENSTLRTYLVDVVANSGTSFKFRNKTDKTEFENILLGKGKAYGELPSTVDASKLVVEGDKKVATKKSAEPKVDLGEETVEPVAVEQKESTIAPAPVVATRVIGYDKYAKKDTAMQIDDVMVKLTQQMDKDDSEKQDKKAPQVDDLFGTGGSSITIDLTEPKKD